jgi:hypothetical protein
MVRTKRRSSFGVFAMLVAMALLCVLAGTSAAAAGNTTRVNLDSLGTQAEGGGSGTPSISANGRYVTFTSSATNLVAGDTNGVQDVFVRDRDTDNNGVMDEPGKTSTERVSVDSSETQADLRSLFRPSISADGRFVAFHSEATNLVPGDTNGFWDVFVRDLKEGTTERVSVDSSGNQGNNHSSNGDFTSISADGRYVAFKSDATNLVPGGSPSGGDIYVRDRTAGTTERINLVNGSTSSVSNGYDFRPSISGDGRYVAWISSASNLVTGDTNTGVAPGYDVFVRDRQTSTTERVSVDSFERQASLGAACQFFCSPNQVSDVSISSDGRYVAWNTSASDLVTGDTNGLDDIYVRDRTAGTTERVSVSGCGTQANDGSFSPSISADGGYVVFSSRATNLVAGDTNATIDVFVRDLQEKTTGRVNVNSSGTQADNGGGSGDLSADGGYATFSSGATNLVPDDTNGSPDIFVHERGNVAPQPGDCVAPTTTASAVTDSGAAYTSGAWTNENIELTLSAQDNEGGSGIKEIRYSATGAQSIPETVYDPQNPPIINTEGTTTVSYFAIDNAGNRESPAKSFTVKLDKTAPTVGTVSPANAATGVSPTANVEATFSEAMDQSTLTTSTFTLTRQNSTNSAAAHVIYDTANNKATLDPDSTLEGNTTYTATVKGGSTGSKDQAGNALAQDYSWTFITASPPAPSCTITGTANAETISGTSGDDVICAGGGNDTVTGLGGNDTLKGEAGNDKLLGGIGNDTLDGGLKTDTASYSASLTAVIASLAAGTATGEGSDTFIGVENLLGSPKADTLAGSPANNTLTGGGGDDTESGGAGNDKVVGSGGADTLKGEDGADTVNSKDGVNGNDSLDGGSGTDTKITDTTEKSIIGFP